MGGIGSGTAFETADIVLMANDLDALPSLIRHSRTSRWPSAPRSS
jgi:Zn2+/Cd2+-exporting ATPase